MSSITTRMNVLGAQRTSAENNHWYKIFVCSVPSSEDSDACRGLSVQTIATSKELFDSVRLGPQITECDVTLKQVPGPKGQIKFVCTGIAAAPSASSATSKKPV